VIDDMDDSAGPSRVATPSSPDNDTKADGSNNETTQGGAGGSVNGASGASAGDNGAANKPSDNGAANKPRAEHADRSSASATPAPSELPPEVRARLRKLEKLEKTYPGLHRPYPA